MLLERPLSLYPNFVRSLEYSMLIRTTFSKSSKTTDTPEIKSVRSCELQDARAILIYPYNHGAVHYSCINHIAHTTDGNTRIHTPQRAATYQNTHYHLGFTRPTGIRRKDSANSHVPGNLANGRGSEASFEEKPIRVPISQLAVPVPASWDGGSHRCSATSESRGI